VVRCLYKLNTAGCAGVTGKLIITFFSNIFAVRKKFIIAQMTYKLIHWIVKILISLLAKVEVIDWDNLPKQGSYIAVANHAGRLEILLVYYLLDRSDIILMIAEKYRQSVFWNWLARLVDGIFIDRYNADFTALRQVLKRLQKGGILAMSPEGTRSHSGVLQEGHWGAAFLAAKAGVSVIPVGATGTWDQEVLSQFKHFKRAQVTLRVGKPFTLPPLSPYTRDAQLKDGTDEIMCQIAALLPPEQRGFYADHPRLKEILNQKL
jgi:1-acyl-sn-glycerol-3-phosphate acyltransferase